MLAGPGGARTAKQCQSRHLLVRHVLAGAVIRLYGPRSNQTSHHESRSSLSSLSSSAGSP